VPKIQARMRRFISKIRAKKLDDELLGVEEEKNTTVKISSISQQPYETIPINK
jgi:hypothetical protein